MITLKNIIVNQINTNSISITWEIEPTEENLSIYKIGIYRAESPGQPNILDEFDLVADDLDVNDGEYLDTSLSKLETPFRKWYYKLKVKNTDTLEETVSKFSFYFKSTSPDLYHKEILRQKYISLNLFVGRKLFLIKRRTWGTHCSLCWDDVLFRAKDAYCPECYGTGWTLGYFNPVPFLGMISPSPSRNQIMMFGEWSPSDVLLEMLNYPPLVPKDVIVDDDGNRWVVLDTQKVEKLGFTIEQRIQLALIEPDDIVYTLPINYNLVKEEFKYK